MEGCDQALEWISAGLDGALSPEEAALLQAHLALCPACRELQAQFGEIHDALGAVEDVPPPIGLKEDIMAAVRAQAAPAAQPGRPRKIPWRAWGSLAAVLVLVLLGRGVAEGWEGDTGGAAGAPQVNAAVLDEQAGEDGLRADAAAGMESASAAPQEAQGSAVDADTPKVAPAQEPMHETAGSPAGGSTGDDFTGSCVPTGEDGQPRPAIAEETARPEENGAVPQRIAVPAGDTTPAAPQPFSIEGGEAAPEEPPVRLCGILTLPEMITELEERSWEEVEGVQVCYLPAGDFWALAEQYADQPGVTLVTQGDGVGPEEPWGMARLSQTP